MLRIRRRLGSLSLSYGIATLWVGYVFFFVGVSLASVYSEVVGNYATTWDMSNLLLLGGEFVLLAALAMVLVFAMKRLYARRRR